MIELVNIWQDVYESYWHVNDSLMGCWSKILQEFYFNIVHNVNSVDPWKVYKPITECDYLPGQREPETVQGASHYLSEQEVSIYNLLFSFLIKNMFIMFIYHIVFWTSNIYSLNNCLLIWSMVYDLFCFN